jgi:hypothetical protein
MSPSTYSAILSGTGRITWTEAQALLDGSHCTWADLHGLRTGPAPDQTPLTSHLWAWWPDGRCARLRLDEDDVYAATLRPLNTEQPSANATSEVVTVHRHPDAPLWGPADRQAGPLPDEVRQWTYDLLEIPGPHPVSFIHGRLIETASGENR